MCVVVVDVILAGSCKMTMVMVMMMSFVELCRFWLVAITTSTAFEHCIGYCDISDETLFP